MTSVINDDYTIEKWFKQDDTYYHFVLVQDIYTDETKFYLNGARVDMTTVLPWVKAD